MLILEKSEDTRSSLGTPCSQAEEFSLFASRPSTSALLPQILSPARKPPRLIPPFAFIGAGGLGQCCM